MSHFRTCGFHSGPAPGADAEGSVKQNLPTDIGIYTKISASSRNLREISLTFSGFLCNLPTETKFSGILPTIGQAPSPARHIDQGVNNSSSMILHHQMENLDSLLVHALMLQLRI